MSGSKLTNKHSCKKSAFRMEGVFIVIPKPPLLAVVIVPRGFCPKMRPC
ncbi:rfbP protein [Vibrio cholerae]|nr:rfbP protein [Vibrio cholerae]EGR1048149.1 rfbP protein [Vibrio cholerae]EGR4200923.1 rfbP protein [Vibrio cholerae]EGR4346371.1 rfbP protein [Vibrio cholerae]